MSDSSRVRESLSGFVKEGETGIMRGSTSVRARVREFVSVCVRESTQESEHLPPYHHEYCTQQSAPKKGKIQKPFAWP
jgi:hypothetical protein